MLAHGLWLNDLSSLEVGYNFDCGDCSRNRLAAVCGMNDNGMIPHGVSGCGQ
jgi:hypothetical protein